jgi:hemerythrin-like domain-containing protein
MVLPAAPGYQKEGKTMSTATAALRHEHEAILRMLDATEEVASRLKRGSRIAPETLSGLLEFFKLFADRCHHGKEEDLLFPLLQQKGMPGQGGPIGVMLHEHTLGRALIREMSDAADAYTKNPNAGLRWAEAATSYAGLLRSHINKENQVLFVMAERMLSDAEQQELSEAFEKIEIEKMGPGTHERLHGEMDRLLKEIFGEAHALK